jgi:hypothetical protein
MDRPNLGANSLRRGDDGFFESTRVVMDSGPTTSPANCLCLQFFSTRVSAQSGLDAQLCILSWWTPCLGGQHSLKHYGGTL